MKSKTAGALTLLSTLTDVLVPKAVRVKLAWTQNYKSIVNIQLIRPSRVQNFDSIYKIILYKGTIKFHTVIFYVNTFKNTNVYQANILLVQKYKKNVLGFYSHTQTKLECCC